MRYAVIHIGFWLLLAMPGAGQPAPDTAQSSPERLHESIERVLADRLTDAQAAAQAVERLTRLARNPLPVNRVSTADLSALPQLSPLLARRIVEHRDDHGPFASVDGLTAVQGIGPSELQTLRPYLILARSSSSDDASVPSVGTMLDRLELEVLQRATRELDLGRGYDADTSRPPFRGPPGRLTTRLQLRYDPHAQLALTLDKDPGEALRWQPQVDRYGFDHVAGNLTLRDLGPLKTLIVGDYSAQFGQGVALWRGLTFGKGRDPVSPLVRSGQGLVPFQSTSEGRFFRGLATTVAATSSISASAFVSRRRRDATLHEKRSTTASGPRPARTLSSGGLHRTQSELQRRNTLGITTRGGALEYRGNWLRVGATGYWSTFDRPIRPPEQPYRRFDVAGTRTSMASIYARTLVGPYTLFGEVARASSGQYGGLVGGAVDYDGRVQALLLGRRYPRSFPGLYNSAIGESGDTQNEHGLYAGVRMKVTPKWRVGAYVDQYRFPWLNYNVPRPSRGLDTRIVVEYDPRSWLSSYVQLRAEWEEAGVERRGPGGRRLAAVAVEKRQSARWHSEYAFSDVLTLRTRVQLSRFRAAETTAAHGLLLYQGIHLRPVEALELDARVAFFDTDGYEARIYTYEHDLLYSFSVPVLYGQGRRSYILAEYEPVPAVTIEAKYGITWYPHRTTIGSGLNETGGNVAREIRLQVRWSL